MRWESPALGAADGSAQVLTRPDTSSYQTSSRSYPLRPLTSPHFFGNSARLHKALQRTTGHLQQSHKEAGPFWPAYSRPSTPVVQMAGAPKFQKLRWIGLGLGSGLSRHMSCCLCFWIFLRTSPLSGLSFDRASIYNPMSILTIVLYPLLLTVTHMSIGRALKHVSTNHVHPLCA